jgi:invasion protein IalB
MIWSKDRWNMLNHSAGRWMLGAGAGALALAVVVPVTLAQQAQPKSTQTPKTAPAPAAGQAAANEQPPEDAWVKLCMKNEESGNKEICLINHEGLEPNTGMVLIAAAVRKAEGRGEPAPPR